MEGKLLKPEWVRAIENKEIKKLKALVGQARLAGWWPRRRAPLTSNNTQAGFDLNQRWTGERVRYQVRRARERDARAHV